jgi:hypothetical protein
MRARRGHCRMRASAHPFPMGFCRSQIRIDNHRGQNASPMLT